MPIRLRQRAQCDMVKLHLLGLKMINCMSRGWVEFYFYLLHCIYQKDIWFGTFNSFSTFHSDFNPSFVIQLSYYPHHILHSTCPYLFVFPLLTFSFRALDERPKYPCTPTSCEHSALSENIAAHSREAAIRRCNQSHTCKQRESTSGEVGLDLLYHIRS